MCVAAEVRTSHTSTYLVYRIRMQQNNGKMCPFGRKFKYRFVIDVSRKALIIFQDRVVSTMSVKLFASTYMLVMPMGKRAACTHVFGGGASPLIR